MTDVDSFQIPFPKGVSSDLQYNLKTAAVKSRTYTQNIPMQNKSIFVGGDLMIWELNTGKKNTFLDQSQSFLKFSVQCQTAAGSVVQVDNSAFSFLSRLDIYHCSNMLESISNYGDIANWLIDNSMSQSEKASLSGLIGTNNSWVVAQNAALTYAASLEATVQQVPGDRSGINLTTNASMALTPSMCFTLPMLSSIIGVNSSKCLPLEPLGAGPLRCEITLAQNDDAIFSATTGADAKWQITNVEFVASFIEILEDGFETVPKGVPLYFQGRTWRSASTFLAQNVSGEITSLVPHRASSITSLVARFRNYATAAQNGATAAYRRSSSVSPNINYAYWRVANAYLPNKAITLFANGVGSGAEGLANIQKCLHSFSSSQNASSILFEQYNVALAAQGYYRVPYSLGSAITGKDSSNNAFSLGINTETFANRDSILSGLNSLNSNLFFTFNTIAGLDVSSNIVLDFFSEMDVLYVIENGVMTAKY